MAHARLFHVLIAGMALLAPAAALAAAEPTPVSGHIALTFDDLPGLTILDDQAYVTYFNQALLRGLKRHHFPAIGFVNEGKLDDLDRAAQIAVLRAWLDAGMELGNHTFSHDDPDEAGAPGYIADIARGDVVTRPMMAAHGKREQWFRHPYLKTGSTLAARTTIDDWLLSHGYRIAPVTMDADDWEFAEPYDYAISHHDAAMQARIKAEYLSHTQDMIHWYRAASQQLFHRDIPYVILLHATRLNADSLDDLAAVLKRNRLKPVSLARAMADPAYRTRDPYVGPNGLDWMQRWAIELHQLLPKQTDPPLDIQQAYDRVDNDRCSGGSDCGNAAPAPDQHTPTPASGSTHPAPQSYTPRPASGN